jgi:hypothetical protein
MHHHGLVHSHRKREIVRRIFEQWVSTYIHFVEVDVREELRKAKRLPVCNEVDLVTARRESNPELSGDRA